MQVLIRADASPALGAGHVLRCLALARGLREAGAGVAFACRELPAGLRRTLAGEGFAVHGLDLSEAAGWEADAERTGALSGGRPDWLVVDHYRLDARWQARLRPCVGRIMVIDDLADRPHDCDLLLDQNHFPDPQARYRDRAPARCRRLLGPRYALLRPEFRAARRLPPRDGPVRRILVFCGGGAGAGLTRRVAVALAGRGDYELDVVASGGPEDLEATAALCRGLPGARCHPPPADMAALLAGADLAVGAGGVSTWERCCLGLPAVVLSVAPNQEPVARALAEAGAHLYLGPHEQAPPAVLEAAVALLAANPPLRGLLSRRAAALCDGRGVERVLAAMLPDPLALRPATAADAALIYAWRNHPGTRRHSLDGAPLAWEGHRRWLDAVLADPDRALLIGELDGAPVGVLRYDLAGSEATVSVYLDPALTGRGLGPRLLARGGDWLRRHRPDVATVLAHILPANRASTAAFLEAGFRPSHCHYRLDLRHEHFR